MTTQPDDQPGGLTRRQIIAGAGAAAAGAAVLGAGLPGRAGASAPTAHAASALPQAVDPAVTGLTYLPIDMWAFFTAATNPSNGYGRYLLDNDGVGANNAGNPLGTSLPIPAGAVLKNISIAYKGAPPIFVYERPLVNPATEQALAVGPLAPSGGGQATQTSAVNIPIKQGYTYSLVANVSPGETLYGVTIGYVPPPSAFLPFAGASPRALDTRSGAKIGPGEERTLDLTSFGAVGRAAVINLTAADAGGYGYLSVYSADIAYPGNSSVNYTAAGQTIANGVIATLGAGNKIKIRSGETSVHAIVDVIGYLL